MQLIKHIKTKQLHAASLIETLVASTIILGAFFLFLWLLGNIYHNNPSFELLYKLSQFSNNDKKGGNSTNTIYDNNLYDFDIKNKGQNKQQFVTITISKKNKQQSLIKYTIIKTGNTDTTGSKLTF